MSNILTSARNSFRQYKTNGLPASGLNKPSKTEIINTFEIIDGAIDDLSSTVTSLGSRVDDVETIAVSGVRKPKEEIRLLTATNVTIASGLENGDTVDGVTLVTGDRVALVGQSTGSQNGVYIVAASGAASRASDMDSETELLGSYFAVKSGTHAGETWSLVTPSPITVGSTTLTFVKAISGSTTTDEVVAAREGKASLSARLNPLFAAMEDTFTYGPRGIALTLGAADGSNVSYSVNEPIPYDCVVDQIVLNAKAAGTIYFKADTLSGVTETEVARYPVSVLGSGIQTITSFGSDMVFHAGEILNRYGWGVFQFAVTGISASDGGYWPSGAGNASGLTRVGSAAQTYDLMMQVTFRRLAVDSDTVEDIADTAEENEIQVGVLRQAASNLKQSVFGRMRDPVVGTASTARQTVVQLNGALGRGYTKGFQCWAERDEVGVPIRMYTRDDTTHDFVCVREMFVDVVAGDPTLIPARMRVEFGEKGGVFNNANFHITSGDVSDGGGYFAITGNLKRFNLNTLVGNLKQQWAMPYEYDSPGLNRIGNTPMSGQRLLPEHIVRAFDVNIDLHIGESISAIGTRANDFLYVAKNQVETFAQGPRAAKSGSLSGAVSQNGGTATKVAAQERASNSGNSYAYDTVADSVVRGNGGAVAAADRNIDLSAREYGYPRSKHRRFVVAVGHSGYMLHQYTMNGTAIWSQLLREDLAEALARYQEEDPDLDVGCVTIYWANGNNAARGSYVDMDDYPGSGSAVTIDETTFEAVKDQIKRELSDISDYVRGILGQDVQPHFHSHQLSGYMQGDGDFSAVPRNGWWQKACIEVSREVGYYHCYGADFEAERSALDTLHYQGRGYTRNRLVQARGAVQVERGMIRPYFAIPLSVEITGSVVTMFWWSPLAIVVDTTSVTSMTNNGLSVTINDLVTPVTISSVGAPVQSTLNSNLWSISVTLASPPSPSDDVWMHIGRHYGRSTGSGGKTDEAIHNYRLDWAETINGDIVNNVAMTSHIWLPHWFEKADWV